MQHTTTLNVGSYSLEKTLECNQSFRWTKLPDRSYLIQTRDKWCNAKQQQYILTIFTNQEVYDKEFWLNYLGVQDNILNENNSEFIDIMKSSDFLREVYKFSRGLRLMKQDPWECLVCFILSQRNTVNRIHQCVDNICKAAGSPIDNNLFAFPLPEEINYPNLTNCNLGYREKYVYSAASIIKEYNFDLNLLRKPISSREVAMCELLNFQGVGVKVASCVALFSLGFTELFPIDIWIERAINEANITKNDIESFGRYSGLVQEYIYYYMMHR